MTKNKIKQTEAGKNIIIKKVHTTCEQYAMKTKQAARFMGVSERYLRDLSQNHEIAFSPIRGTYRLYRKRDLEDFIDSRRIRAKERSC